jgi:hypothetical protein
MTAISYRDGIAIAELIFYVPALLIALLLAIRHGFGLLSGWRLLVIFTLVRLLYACFQIATITYPTNVSLYIGAFVCLNIAISPLELTTIGLLTRVIQNINNTKPTWVTVKYLRALSLIITVGLVLTIVGGVYAGNEYSDTGVYTPQSTSKAGLGLWIACFVGIVAATVATSFHISHADSSEKLILLAVAVSLPLMLVRLVYSAIGTFAYVPRLNTETGSVTLLLCMALLEEVAIVCIYEGVGLTLKKVEKPRQTSPTGAGGSHDTMVQSDADLRYVQVDRRQFWGFGSSSGLLSMIWNCEKLKGIV